MTETNTDLQFCVGLNVYLNFFIPVSLEWIIAGEIEMSGQFQLLVGMLLILIFGG